MFRRGGQTIRACGRQWMSTATPSRPAVTTEGAGALHGNKKPRYYWKERENQRAFLEQLRAQLGIPSVRDWRHVPAKTLMAHGGASLLRQYPSFHHALQVIYPEENWPTPAPSRATSPTWTDDEIRAFLSQLGETLGLQSEEDWGRVSARIVKDHGGATLMAKRPSLFDLLSDVFPDRDWWKSGLQMKIPRRFWESRANQIKFMNKLGERLGIDRLPDWVHVSPQKIEAHGGRRLLEMYHTMQDLLMAIYPEENWAQASQETLTHFVLRPKRPTPARRRMPVASSSLGGEDLSSSTSSVDPHGLNLKSYSPVEAVVNTLPEGMGSDDERTQRVMAALLPPHRVSQRQWMDELGRRLGVREHNDWITHTMDVVLAEENQPEALAIAREYPTLSVALRRLYPEYRWSQLPQARQLPHRYWSEYWMNEENHAPFMELLASRLHIRQPSDWVYITRTQVKDNGGFGLLFYYGTLSGTLRALYPQHDWSLMPDSLRYPPRWRHVPYQRAFLDQIGAELHITSPSEWRSVTAAQIRALGGSPLLACYPSFYEALRTIYPEHPWSVKEAPSNRVPRGHWRSLENQRAFLDEIADKFSLETARDWTRMTARTLREQGGLSLLKQYPSFYSMLRTVYPDKSWDFFLEDLQTLPNYYWNDPANVRSFVEHVARQHDIRDKADWFNLPESALADVFGGRALLKAYGSLFNVLRMAYPDETWEPSLFHTGPTLTETVNLTRQLRKMFPSLTVHSEYTHDDIRKPSSSHKFKSHAYVPALHLAFRYQRKSQSVAGEKRSSQYYESEQALIDACKAQGVRLLIVPYWHDWAEHALREHLLSVYPDLRSSLSPPSSSSLHLPKE